jgi:hypothetical protein
MPRAKAPFRADHVGSLLRPAALKTMRVKREPAEICPDEFRTIEDREIENAITHQEPVGLQSVSRLTQIAHHITVFRPWAYRSQFRTGAGRGFPREFHVSKEVVGTRGLLGLSFFGGGILRRLLPPVSLAKPTSARLRF